LRGNSKRNQAKITIVMNAGESFMDRCDYNAGVLNLSGLGSSDIKFDSFKFPDGQPHLRIASNGFDIACEGGNIIIMCSIRSADDLFLVAQAVDALKGCATQHYREYYQNPHLNSATMPRRCPNYTLYAPYIFAGRSDRRFQKGDALDSGCVYSLLRSLGFDKIITFDHHAPERFSLPVYIWEGQVWNSCALDRDKKLGPVKFISPYPFVKAIAELGNYALCFPDQSAHSRVMEDNVCFNGEKPGSSPPKKTIFLEKVRNERGEITSHKITSGLKHVWRSDILVVDDICDGGATFISAAKILREKGAPKLSLYISHGLFTKGLGPLLEYYDKIYFTNSTLTPERESQLKAEGGERINIINVFDSSFISENLYV
jgi:ribose-phosphate pyrophosphokinase